MDLSQSVHARVRLFAMLDEDGALTLKATAHAEYAPGQTASVDVSTIEQADEDAIRGALQQALESDSVRTALSQQLPRALVVSRIVAEQRGDITR